jgi:hypothetical protein
MTKLNMKELTPPQRLILTEIVKKRLVIGSINIKTLKKIWQKDGQDIGANLPWPITLKNFQ